MRRRVASSLDKVLFLDFDMTNLISSFEERLKFGMSDGCFMQVSRFMLNLWAFYRIGQALTMVTWLKANILIRYE